MRVRLIVSIFIAISMAAPGSHLPRAAVADDEGPKELEAFQAYLDPAPSGMDVRYAWTVPGGKGENVKIVDIEYNWNLNHNDLTGATSNTFLLVRGIDHVPDPAQNEGNINHGTAVLGELVAADDGIGVTGIAHKARIGLVNPLTNGTTPDAVGAIERAASSLDPGDVMLLELSVAGPRFDPFVGRGLVPVEYDPAIFAAIKAATDAGIIVIESAGNGFDNLDHPDYGGAFNRNNRNSGAMIVGAGKPPEGGIYGSGPDRTRIEQSNYGSRVDLQGWGIFVTTCGYGDLRREQGENNWYTIEFGFTSAATAMVAGAAAVLQSIVKQRGRAPLTPAELRRLLVSTGTPQAGNTSQHIGPRPNLRAAIANLDSPAPDPAISRIKLKSGAKLVVDGAGFTAGDSIVEINGTAVSKMKYPAEYQFPSGETTRLTTKGDISALLPKGVEVSIVVFTPSSGKRSETFPFTR
ncbi:MAG TPA: S8 family serine peptidase [Blastocatellia bacterium]|nr:S8 family serine peptidase [Blastocatellia bacterium]